MANWLGWNIGGGSRGGSVNRSSTSNVEVEVEVLGNIGSTSDAKAIHRAEIVVYERSEQGDRGQELARQSTMGTLGHLLQQADGIRESGDRHVARSRRQQRQDRLRSQQGEFGEGPGEGGGGYEPQGPTGGR